MNPPASKNDTTWAILNRIVEMMAGPLSLPTFFRTLAEGAQNLANARWGLFLVRPIGQPAEFYGPEEALPLGPLLLQALEQNPIAGSTTAVLELTFPNPCPTSDPLHVQATPILQGATLRAGLAVIYQQPPETPADSILELLASQARIAMEKRRLHSVVSQGFSGTIRALASAIDARDPSTHRHAQAVTELSVALAETLGLVEEEIDTIRYAAILHDIGKIGISEKILSKPGPLTPGERAVVEAHPLVGVSILSGIPDMEALIPLILHHHERYDGSGYPDGLRDSEIPFGAQIIAIADTFDAMTTERPYHRAMAIPDVCTYLEQEAGKLFHPQLVTAFLRMIRHRLRMNRWDE
jgi:putative nucleotidyltransferase with HDIG domain